MPIGKHITTTLENRSVVGLSKNKGMIKEDEEQIRKRNSILCLKFS